MAYVSTLSRRSFVAGAAATAGLATAGLLTSDAYADEAAAQDVVPPQWVAEVPETWDREAEVLVLGCGIAGACATVEAADLGASVITVDAAAEVTDCSCTLSGGWVCGCNTLLQEEEGIEDSVDVFVSDMRRDGGDAGDPDVIRAWAEISGETVDWLWDLGCDVVDRTYDARTTAGSDAHSVARDYITNPAGNGLGWMEGLQAAIEERDVELLSSTKATKLYRATNGRVVGARVEAMDDPTAVQNIKATKAVILATGGLGVNLEEHQRYTPAMRSVCAEADKILFSCSQNCLGNGYTMAREVNAYLFNSPVTHGHSVQVTADGESDGWLPFIWCAQEALIEVNLDGERFNDETSFEQNYNQKLWQNQPKMVSYLVIDETTRTSENGRTYVQAQIDQVAEEGIDTIQSADALEELAQKIGVPADALLASVEDFNARVDSQEPDEFGRTAFARKLETPPFWAARCDVTLGISKGGCKINPQAQVLDTRDEVIPGLYAAGEMAFAQLHGDARTHIVGGPNSSAACYGRIAARGAAAETPWA